uniref:Uncharacterized protein n=1 Tax=Oryza meridionalis TaxID=40149 RepID=A0A0E0E455_9ORYZ
MPAPAVPGSICTEAALPKTRIRPSSSSSAPPARRPEGERQVVGFLQLRTILGNTACPAWQVADQSGSELRAQ